MTGSGQIYAFDLPILFIPEIAGFSEQFIFCNSLIEGYINALILSATEHFERFSFITFVN